MGNSGARINHFFYPVIDIFFLGDSFFLKRPLTENLWSWVGRQTIKVWGETKNPTYLQSKIRKKDIKEYIHISIFSALSVAQSQEFHVGCVSTDLL